MGRENEDTRGNSGSLLSLMYQLQAGALRRWQWTAPRLTLLAGAVIDGTIGGSYDTRNTNNPAQARLALALAPTARLSWKCGSPRHPMTLHYQVAIPLIGMAFSPNYGFHENYPNNYSDSLVNRYLGTDYRIANGMKYRILDDQVGFLMGRDDIIERARMWLVTRR